MLSDGRVILGVGAGWNRQEMRNHGTDPKTRMRLLTERVQAMIEIWTKDEAGYDLLQAWPKPVQTPYPPIMVGEAGRTVEDRVLAFSDGRAPMIAGIKHDVFDRFARLQDRTDKPLELTASGPDPDRRTLTRLRDRGAHRALVWLPQDSGGAISDSDTADSSTTSWPTPLSEVEAIPITPSWTGSWSDPAERLAGDHQQDAGQSGRRHDDEREPNGRAVPRAGPAKAAGSAGNSPW